METIKNVTQLFVVKKQTPTADLEGNVISTYTDLKDGEAAVCDYKNTVIDAASTSGYNRFKIIARVGNDLIQSDMVHKGTVRSYSVTGQSNEAKQVDYVGYNGSSGSLGTLASTIHTIRLYVDDPTISGFMQQKVKEGFYKSAASTSQAAIAAGLVESLIKNYSREPEQDLLFERVCSGTKVALGTSVNTVTLTKGSKYFTATDIDDATGAGTALAVGDYLAIPTGSQRKVTLAGSSGTATVSILGLSLTASFDTDAAGTAAAFVTSHYDTLAAVGVTVANPSGGILTFTTRDGSAIPSFAVANATGDLAGTLGTVAASTTGVYKISALNTTTNVGTLDIEYQGESIVYDDLELMQVEAASLGDFGIKISGKEREFLVGKFASRPITFTTVVDFGDSSSTEATKSVAASSGQGTWKKLQTLEKELQADEYVYRMFVEGAPEDRMQIEKHKLYDVMSIEYDGEIQSGLGTTVKSPKSILVAFEGTTNLSASDDNQGIVDCLDALLVTSWVEAGASAQYTKLS